METTASSTTGCLCRRGQIMLTRRTGPSKDSLGEQQARQDTVICVYKTIVYASAGRMDRLSRFMPDRSTCRA